MTSSTTNKDIESFGILPYSFTAAGSKVTEMIMFDNNYFVFILDEATINLVVFDARLFGKTYTDQNIATIINNESKILKIKGYSTGDYRIRGDYKYLFVTHEVQDGKNWIRKYEISPESNTIVQVMVADLGSIDITCIDLNKEYIAIS
jgi:hypothetical protein